MTDAVLRNTGGPLSNLFGGDRPERGVLIAGVVSGGPAERAGLRRGDLVLEIDGEPVRSARELLRRVAGMTPGQETRLTLLRDGREQSVTVQVAERPAQVGR